jgi:glycine/D-amino acid oxidase-like deaminating enzyme
VRLGSSFAEICCKINKFKVRAEFLIVGGGLAGMSLTLELTEKNRTVLLLDDEFGSSSSRVAAGMINPIVPKGVRKTWLCDEIFPKIDSWYTKWEGRLNAFFYKSMPLIQIHPDERTALEWKKRSEDSDFDAYLEQGTDPLPAEIHAPFGYSIIKGGGRLNVANFLRSGKQYLMNRSAMQVHTIKYGEIVVDQTGVEWNGMRFSAVIFCEGIAAMQNPWFGDLHFHPTGGDVLRVKTEWKQPTPDVMWKRRQWLLPDGEGNYLLGSNFHKGETGIEPQAKDAEMLISETKSWFGGNIKLLEHRRGTRPTVEGRRPYLGNHSSGKPIYIFNGLGSKGSSLVTLLAPMMADYLCEAKPLNSEVDIRRFD